MTFAHIQIKFNTVYLFDFFSQTFHGIDQGLPGFLVEGPHGSIQTGERGYGISHIAALHLAEFQHTAIADIKGLKSIDIADEFAGGFQGVLSFFGFSAVSTDSFNFYCHGSGFCHHRTGAGGDFTF